MRRINFNDATTEQLKYVKIRFEDLKSKINKKVKEFGSFLNDGENIINQDLASSFIYESKIMDTFNIDFNLENLKN